MESEDSGATIKQTNIISKKTPVIFYPYYYFLDFLYVTPTPY